MKHTDLKPGDIVLKKGLLGPGLKDHTVIKVTPKTLQVAEVDKRERRPYVTRHGNEQGGPLYLPNSDVVSRLTELDDEIAKLYERKRGLRETLERVTFEEDP